MKISKTYFLTVLGKDQTGIIAAVANILAKLGCNLEDISMTILEDQFCMVMVATFKSKDRVEKGKKELEKIAQKKKLTIAWHKLTPKKKQVIRKKANKSTRKYLISAYGKDRAGIVATISNYLAKKKMNITDLNSEMIAGRKAKIYALVLEFESNRAIKETQFKSGMQKIAKKLRVEINLRPVEELEF